LNGLAVEDSLLIRRSQPQAFHLRDEHQTAVLVDFPRLYQLALGGRELLLEDGLVPPRLRADLGGANHDLDRLSIQPVAALAARIFEYDLLGQFIRPEREVAVSTGPADAMPVEEIRQEGLSPKAVRRLDWLSLGLRLLLAIGVIEAMPDQALFSIIHPGPAKLLLPRGRRWQAAREQWWPFCRGILCRHLDRSSSVFAILSVIFGGDTDRTVGWVCYWLAITQFLIIGLVSSRDKALDVLSEFDQQVHLRREELAGHMAGPEADDAGMTLPPPASVDHFPLD
jgi:hypothetical protein